MTLSRRVRSGAAFQIGARLWSAVATFVVTAVVLARVLPEAEYGRFQFYLTMFLLAMQLVDCGVNRAAIRLVTTEAAPRDGVLRAAIAAKGSAGVVAFLVMAAVALLTEDDGVTRVVLVLAAAHALSHGFSTGSIGFEVDLAYRVPATSVVLGYSVFLGAGLVLAALGIRDAAPYLVAWGAGITLQNVYLLARAAGSHGVAARLDRDLLRRLVREALPLGISAVAIAIYFYSDTIMLRPLCGDEEVARYSVAYRLMTFGLMVPVLFSQVLFPVFARCQARSTALLGAAVRGSTFYLALLGGVSGAILYALAPELLELVFGAPYRDAAAPLRILAVAMVVVHLTYSHSNALVASGRARAFTAITVASAVLNVALNLVVLPRFGPEGAAATTLVTEGFVLVASVFALQKTAGISGASLRLVGPAALAGVLVVGLAVLAPARPLWLTLAVALAIAVAGALLLKALPFQLGVDDEELR